MFCCYYHNIVRDKITDAESLDVYLHEYRKLVKGIQKDSDYLKVILKFVLNLFRRLFQLCSRPKLSLHDTSLSPVEKILKTKGNFNQISARSRNRTLVTVVRDTCTTTVPLHLILKVFWNLCFRLWRAWIWFWLKHPWCFWRWQR